MTLAAISPFALAAGVILLALIWIVISPQLAWSWKIPGPFFAKYTRLWYLRQIYTSDFHWTNIRLHREKGMHLSISLDSDTKQYLLVVAKTQL